MKHFRPILALLSLPTRLYAVEPAKEPTFTEKLSAWLKDKEQMTIDLSAANQRAATAEAALATAKTEAGAAATTAATALTAATEAKTKAESDLVAANSQITALNGQLTGLNSIFSATGFKPAANTTFEALQAAWNAHIANGVTQKLAELGVKSDKLPAAVSTADAENMEDLQASLAAATDPAEKGRIAAKINKLRDASWGSN